jgi:hypothetical protein
MAEEAAGNIGLGQNFGQPYTGWVMEIPMSETQFAGLSRRLRSSGIELTGMSGTLTKDGVTAKYGYADGILSVEVVDRPKLLPLSLIEGKLQAYLEQSIAYDASRSAL